MRNRLAVLSLAVVTALLAASAASASPSLMLGLMDDARVFGDHDRTFARLSELRPQVLRVTLRWDMVAATRPANPAHHGDPSYEWAAYDRIALAANASGTRILFTIFGTPRWANGGRAWNHPPRDAGSLSAFAFAAASRYSGLNTGSNASAGTLPRVTMWTAWNEPNLRYFLVPGPRTRRVSYATAAARTYARICNAVMRGVHAAQSAMPGEKVACGVTSPRKKPGSTSTGPLDFLRALKRAGARFDVYAHHPHPPIYTRPPNARPRNRGTITLGNIDVLLSELGRLYGRQKKLWITEYAYQTRPPDYFGVSLRGQSAYLRQAYAIAKRNRRIDMLVWFLLRDEPSNARRGVFGLPGWQSGLLYDWGVNGGAAKPAFWRFRCLAARRSASGC